MRILTLTASAIALGLSAMAVSANPASMVRSATVDTTPTIERVHGWHRACQRGYAGWHYHSRYHGRVACPPPRRGRY